MKNLLSNDPTGVIKTMGLVAGYLLSILAILLLAWHATDGTRDQLIQTLTQIALGSGAAIGILRLADLATNILNVRRMSDNQNTPGVMPQTLPTPLINVPVANESSVTNSSNTTGNADAG